MAYYMMGCREEIMDQQSIQYWFKENKKMMITLPIDSQVTVLFKRDSYILS